jgi:glycosyltransferase involved in cell wall biosynthesis
MVTTAGKLRLAVFATHPIQYQVPWFRALAAEPGLEVVVYYALLPDAEQQGTGFGRAFAWDVPLLDGYHWELLENRARRPSVDSFRGCDVRGLVRALRGTRPDVALITGWNALFLLQAFWACKRLGIPALVRGDSNVLAPRGGLKRMIQHGLIRQFSGYLAVGELNRRLYVQAGVPETRLFFCPHFVDNDEFAQRAAARRGDRTEVRQRWGVPADAVCFVFVGKLVPKKRVMDFLAALDAASRAGATVFGLVAGSGAQMDEARAFVDSRQVPVTFAGFLNQSEIAAAYVAADCLVLPSDYGETWGLVVNEAMACGLPAIVSDQVGCGPDLVSDDETGWVYRMGDVAALSGRMQQAAREAERLPVMGEAARQRVMRDYSIARAVDGACFGIDWLLSRSGSRR